MSVRRAVMVGLLLGLGQGLAAQQLTPTELARVDSVFSAIDGTARPGCALGVSRNGELVYQRGYGMANLETGTAITPGSIFHVASISKQFTAMAVALLARDGKLSLDDDIRKYLPEIPDYGHRITLANLIHHTSGLRDQWNLLGMAGWRFPEDLITEQDVLDIVSRQRGLNFTPGDEYIYSNTGFTLLAVIVKRVSGKSLRDFADERIFKPLGMTQTHFHDNHAMVVPGRTSAYEAGPPGPWKVSIPTFDTYGATSLFTTVGDLLKWEQNFASAAVGGKALIDAAQQPTKLNNGSALPYGYGLSLESYRGVRAVGHGGADAGYRADVVRFPDQGVAITALCNFGTAQPNGLTRKVADVLLEGSLQARPAAAGPAITLTRVQLDRLAGVYKRRNVDDALKVAVKDSGLVVLPYGIPLKATADTRFFAEGFPVEVVFDGPAGAAIREMRLVVGTEPPRVFDRMAPFAPSPRELDGYAGEYYSTELDTRYTVSRKDSVLTVRGRKSEPVTLVAVFADAFQAEGAGTIRFERTTHGRITGFRITDDRVRNVAFVRLPSAPVSPRPPQ